MPRPHAVAIETVGFYRWLWEMLEPIVEELVLADATQARALAGRRLKTDREDALNIAELLADGRLPTCYAPPWEVQILRDVTRHRSGFSRQHARILCRVTSIMNANNRPGPARLESDGLIRYLKAQGDKLPERHVAMLWNCVDHLALCEQHIAQAERTIAELVKSPSFAADFQLLVSFPGVALVAAATILAEVGDFRRFKSAKSIARFAGLNPWLYSSDKTHRLSSRACFSTHLFHRSAAFPEAKSSLVRSSLPKAPVRGIALPTFSARMSLIAPHRSMHREEIRRRNRIVLMPCDLDVAPCNFVSRISAELHFARCQRPARANHLQHLATPDL